MMFDSPHTLAPMLIRGNTLVFEKHLSKIPREPALRNTSHGPRTSLQQLIFHPTDHVQQDIHPTDNQTLLSWKSGAGEAIFKSFGYLELYFLSIFFLSFSYWRLFIISSIFETALWNSDPSHTSERGGEGDCVKEGGGGEGKCERERALERERDSVVYWCGYDATA